MKSIAELRACSMTDNELAMMFRKGDDRDKRIARCELAGRGYQTYAGISLRDPENGNGKVAPEEVERAIESINLQYDAAAKNVKHALVFDKPLLSLQDVRAFVVRDRLSPCWVMADGTTMSVQFHEDSYCEPRGLSIRERFHKNLRIREVEVGFPSKRIEALMPYAEDAENPTDTVYGYVPERVMTYIIEQCGGIVRVEDPCKIEILN